MRGDHEQVALVLAVLVIHEHDHTATLQFIDDLGDGTNRHKKSGLTQ
jgi:hypothetical protein